LLALENNSEGIKSKLARIVLKNEEYMLKTLLLVALGGMLGSVCRFLVSFGFLKYYPQLFPWPTFIVNLFGCLLMGIFWGLGQKNAWFSSDLRLLCMTGFCGGFTTFSAFALENMQLLKQQQFTLFLTYALASVLVGVLATWGGYWIAQGA
jgi:CrcB protein